VVSRPNSPSAPPGITCHQCFASLPILHCVYLHHASTPVAPSFSVHCTSSQAESNLQTSWRPTPTSSHDEAPNDLSPRYWKPSATRQSARGAELAAFHGRGLTIPHTEVLRKLWLVFRAMIIQNFIEIVVSDGHWGTFWESEGHPQDRWSRPFPGSVHLDRKTREVVLNFMAYCFAADHFVDITKLLL
jgi:hypothetical protein